MKSCSRSLAKRLFALLLIPSLAADPAASAGFSQLSGSACSQSIANQSLRIQSEALSLRSADFFRSRFNQRPTVQVANDGSRAVRFARAQESKPGQVPWEAFKHWFNRVSSTLDRLVGLGVPTVLSVISDKSTGMVMEVFGKIRKLLTRRRAAAPAAGPVSEGSAPDSAKANDYQAPSEADVRAQVSSDPDALERIFYMIDFSALKGKLSAERLLDLLMETHDDYVLGYLARYDGVDLKQDKIVLTMGTPDKEGIVQVAAGRIFINVDRWFGMEGWQDVLLAALGYGVLRDLLLRQHLNRPLTRGEKLLLVQKASSRLMGYSNHHKQLAAALGLEQFALLPAIGRVIGEASLNDIALTESSLGRLRWAMKLDRSNFVDLKNKRREMAGKIQGLKRRDPLTAQQKHELTGLERDYEATGEDVESSRDFERKLEANNMLESLLIAEFLTEPNTTPQDVKRLLSEGVMRRPDGSLQRMSIRRPHEPLKGVLIRDMLVVPKLFDWSPRMTRTVIPEALSGLLIYVRTIPTRLEYHEAMNVLRSQADAIQMEVAQRLNAAAIDLETRLELDAVYGAVMGLVVSEEDLLPQYLREERPPEPVWDEPEITDAEGARVMLGELWQPLHLFAMRRLCLSVRRHPEMRRAVAERFPELFAAFLQKRLSTQTASLGLLLAIIAGDDRTGAIGPHQKAQLQQRLFDHIFPPKKEGEPPALQTDPSVLMVAVLGIGALGLINEQTIEALGHGNRSWVEHQREVLGLAVDRALGIMIRQTILRESPVRAARQLERLLGESHGFVARAALDALREQAQTAGVELRRPIDASFVAVLRRNLTSHQGPVGAGGRFSKLWARLTRWLPLGLSVLAAFLSLDALHGTSHALEIASNIRLPLHAISTTPSSPSWMAAATQLVPYWIGLGIPTVLSVISKKSTGMVMEVFGKIRKLLTRRRAAAPAAPGRSQSPSASRASTRKYKVLVVDDNPNWLNTFVEFLTDVGYDAVGASNGAEALQEFERAEFDLVITDWQMPVMDGVTLIKELRQRQPQLPIILRSGEERSVLFETAEKLGVEATPRDSPHNDLLNKITGILKPPAAAPASDAKKTPKGSPLGVFQELMREERWFTEADLCQILGRQLTTLKPDFRALVHHLGLARSGLVGDEVAYKLLDETRRHLPELLVIQHDLQQSARRHYRPSVPEMKTVREEKIDPVLGRSAAPAPDAAPSRDLFPDFSGLGRRLQDAFDGKEVIPGIITRLEPYELDKKSSEWRTIADIRIYRSGRPLGMVGSSWMMQNHGGVIRIFTNEALSSGARKFINFHHKSYINAILQKYLTLLPSGATLDNGIDDHETLPQLAALVIRHRHPDAPWDLLNLPYNQRRDGNYYLNRLQRELAAVAEASTDPATLNEIRELINHFGDRHWLTCSIKDFLRHGGEFAQKGLGATFRGQIVERAGFTVHRICDPRPEIAGSEFDFFSTKPNVPSAERAAGIEPPNRQTDAPDSELAGLVMRFFKSHPGQFMPSEVLRELLGLDQTFKDRLQKTLQRLAGHDQLVQWPSGAGTRSSSYSIPIAGKESSRGPRFSVIQAATRQVLQAMRDYEQPMTQTLIQWVTKHQVSDALSVLKKRGLIIREGHSPPFGYRLTVPEFYPSTVSLPAPLSEKSEPDWMAVEELLIQRHGFKPVDAYPMQDGFYFDGTIRDHEKQPVKAGKWGIRIHEINVLRGEGGYFIRFGAYAIVDNSLRKYIPKQLWKNALFLDTIQEQFIRERHGFEYCLPYLAQIYTARNHFQGANILEMGVGRGIAALFAVKLGAHMVVGIEKDSSAEKSLQRARRLNGIKKYQAIFISGEFDDKSIVSKLKDYGPFNMVMANIGPHGIYGDDQALGFAIGYGLGTEGSNIKALELVNALHSRGLIASEFHHIGGGFSEDFVDLNECAGHYSPQGEIAFLRHHFNIRDIHTLIYRTHPDNAFERWILSHSYRVTLARKAKPPSGEPGIYQGYFGNILFSDFKRPAAAPDAKKDKLGGSTVSFLGTGSLMKFPLALALAAAALGVVLAALNAPLASVATGEILLPLIREFVHQRLDKFQRSFPQRKMLLHAA